MMPALPRLPAQDSPPDLIIIDSIPPTLPARHRGRYSSSLQKLSTITPESCARPAGIGVHNALESLSTISRINHREGHRSEFCSEGHGRSGGEYLVSYRRRANRGAGSDADHETCF
jgi:hypothetical protein